MHFGEYEDKAKAQDTMPPVVILCGGRGERLGAITLERPKPMVEIGGKPILWHIMKHFVQHGCHRFYLALGYLGWVVEYYFREQNGFGDNTDIRCIPTGWDTMNAGRIKRLERFLHETFFLAWCDGVSDIDLTKMLSFHRGCGKHCTVAAVQPPERFGSLTISEVNGFVTDFREKGRSPQWINGGFFVCEPDVLEYIGGNVAPDQMQWERQPMARLAKDGQLMAYKHEGFWACMDTDKDRRELEALWQQGAAPWKTWRVGA